MEHEGKGAHLVGRDIAMEGDGPSGHGRTQLCGCAVWPRISWNRAAGEGWIHIRDLSRNRG